jgi:hypothetical protein
MAMSPLNYQKMSMSPPQDKNNPKKVSIIQIYPYELKKKKKKRRKIEKKNIKKKKRENLKSKGWPKLKII